LGGVNEKDDKLRWQIWYSIRLLLCYQTSTPYFQIRAEVVHSQKFSEYAISTK